MKSKGGRSSRGACSRRRVASASEMGLAPGGRGLLQPAHAEPCALRHDQEPLAAQRDAVGLRDLPRVGRFVLKPRPTGHCKGPSHVGRQSLWPGAGWHAQQPGICEGGESPLGAILLTGRLSHQIPLRGHLLKHIKTKDGYFKS